MTWERAVPAFLPFVAGFLVTVAILWSGILLELPVSLHAASLIIGFVALTLLLLRGANRFRFPTKNEALRRIEEKNGLRPGRLDGVYEKPFASAEDDPLWVASRERLLAAIGHLKAPRPRLSMRKADPYRLRYIAPLLLVGAIALTGGQRDDFLASVDPRFTPPDPMLVDAWIEPPAYTGLSPLVIRFGETRGMLRVPEDSELHIRLREDTRVRSRGILTYRTVEGGRRRIRLGRDGSARMTLDMTGILALDGRAGREAVTLSVREDEPPRVAILGDPETAGGAIRFLAETRDAYPLANAELVVSLLPGQKMSRDAPDAEASVVDVPARFPLPALIGPPTQAEVEIESEAHPWAGLLVRAEVEVTDGRGQTAVSEPFGFRMPERTFYSPLSQAVIEERRKLAMAPSTLNKTAQLFGALTVAPDLFDVEFSEQLMMRATAQAIAAATYRDVPEIVESLWPLAIELEDDGLAYAKARLDEAEAALREALQSGASDEEVSERIADLRQAMDDYIRALIESGDAQIAEADGSEMQGADLQDLLDQMENLARQGAREEAESLLSQLEAMMQSLQLAQGGSPGQGEGEGQMGPGGEGDGEGEGRKGSAEGALSGAGDFIQRQRELSDETFSARRGDRSSDGLGGSQGDLARELGELRDALEKEAEGAGDAFDRARRAMEEAAQDLRNGNLSSAQGRQEEAIQALRDAGAELAEALEEGTENGDVAGSDPFGRAYEGREGGRAEDFGLYDPERIRALIGAIRERLRNPDLSEEERRYLESLLERF
jgi:uncharacterized protein (TIGR02302 family)